MRTLLRACLLLLLCVTILLPNITRAQDAPANPLLDMLALVPDNADAHPSNGFSISYADYRALVQTSGIDIPAAGTQFSALSSDAQAQYFRVFQRLSAGMQLDYLKTYLEGMQKSVGFDWFSVGRALVYGTPPRLATILGGQFNADDVGQALKARNFESTTVDGVTIWSRFEDGKVNIKDIDRTDPFGGELGAAARIALLPGYIANSRFTDETNAIVSAFNKKSPSLAQSEDYRVLTQAITDPNKYTGSLIQAQFAEPALFEGAKLPANGTLPTPPDLSGELPAYTLAVLADRQEGDTQVNLIAVVYADVATAQKGADELYKRIAGFNLRNMYTTWQVAVDQPYVYQDDKGRAVAVVSVHYPLPKPPDANGSNGPASTAGNVYRNWLLSIFRREFYPLALKPPQP
jgi:hypothetical protein